MICLLQVVVGGKIHMSLLQLREVLYSSLDRHPRPRRIHFLGRAEGVCTSHLMPAF
jgi:hypothetical protein